MRAAVAKNARLGTDAEIESVMKREDRYYGKSSSSRPGSPGSSGSPGSPGAPGLGGRGEPQGSDDDRPFSEIRRTIYDALRLLSVHRWSFFVPFCLVCCGAFVGSLYLPRTYKATTSFSIENDPVMINGPMSAGLESYRYFRKSMSRELMAVERMGPIVETLSLAGELYYDADGSLTSESLQRRNSVARSIAGNLSVTTTAASELTDVVTITYTGPDSTIGRSLVDEIKEAYMARAGEWMLHFLSRRSDYYAREAGEARQEMLGAKREDALLRMENPLVDPGDPAAIVAKLSQLQVERRDLKLRRREYESELAAHQQFLAATAAVPVAVGSDGQTTGDPLMSAAAISLATELRQTKQEMLLLRRERGLRVAHPDMAALYADAERLTKHLETQRAADQERMLLAGDGDAAKTALLGPPAAGQVWSPETAQVNTQITATVNKIREVDLSLKSNEQLLADIEEAKSNVFEHQEEFLSISSRIGQARKRMEQAEKTVGGIAPSIKGLQQDRMIHFTDNGPARGGSIPISPKATTIVLLSLLAGLAAGGVFVILAEVLDHVYRSSWQVARSLGLPLLEAIDEIVTAQDRRRALVQRAVVLPAIILICLGITGLTGSMAYLSIKQPWTYQRLRHIPDAAIDLFIDRGTDDADPDPNPDSNSDSDSDGG